MPHHVVLSWQITLSVCGIDMKSRWTWATHVPRDHGKEGGGGASMEAWCGMVWHGMWTACVGERGGGGASASANTQLSFYGLYKPKKWVKWQVEKLGLFFDMLMEFCTNKLKSQQVGAKNNKLQFKSYQSAYYYFNFISFYFNFRTMMYL